MDRLTYAHSHRTQYLDWCQRLQDSPVTPTRRLEFAILSANTPFDQAVRVWQGVGEVEGPGAIRDVMRAEGMGLYGLKVEAIEAARANPTEYPRPDYRQYRANVKLPGLAWSKLSFAACLIDPLNSNIVCLDTHMVQEYTGVVPDGDWFKCKPWYRAIENRLRFEANGVGMPMFAYQWATWDSRRGRQEDHSFMWEE